FPLISSSTKNLVGLFQFPNDSSINFKSVQINGRISLFHEFIYQRTRQNPRTANYDRVIEYACDQKRIFYDTRFQGGYIKYCSTKPITKNKIVNIFKVHGSLDLFKDENNLVCSIPGLYNKPPDGFLPEIITPGTSKYKAVLTGSCRSVLHEADTVINEASSFLCIGYGFNDEQIQERIITGIKSGKPIVVVTKVISNKAVHLLESNSSNFIIVEENSDKPNTTRFKINKEQHCLDGTFWTIQGFQEII
ncbi:MAG: SIR2 family protein, partial [Lachnoclostridium sp.]|nr:SIR2 family protein [Lachnoclostridium sp.]